MKPNNIRFYPLPELYNVQLVHGVQVIHRFPRHIHQTVSVGVIESGVRCMTVGKESVRLAAGDCFILNANESHSCLPDSGEPYDYRVISIPDEIMQRMTSELTGKAQEMPYFAPTALHDQKLFHLIMEFAHELQEEAELFQQETLLLAIVTHCLARYTENAENLQRIAPCHSEVRIVRAYLEEHVDESIRLDDLAKRVRLSPCYLNRIFQQEIGVPPYEYLVKIRLKRAYTLLQQGESIASAAYSAGFSDQSHFTRFFKKHVGMTPGEYARQLA